MTNKKILWLLGSGDNRNRINYIQRKMREIYPPAANAIIFIHLNKSFKFWVKKPKTKAVFMLTDNYVQQIHNTIGVALHSSSVVVLNDFSALSAVLDGKTEKKTKLAAFRGGKYVKPLFNNLPAIVCDDVSKAYMPPSKNPNATLAESPSVADQFNEYDFEKIIRHWLGTESKSPDFDSTYRLVAPDHMYLSEEEMSLYPDNMQSQSAGEFVAWLNKQSMLSLDYETSGNNQSCLGVSGIENFDVNTIKTFTIPLINPTMPEKMHMHSGTYFNLQHKIFETNIPKIWANGGAFDLMYAMKANMFMQPRMSNRNQHHDLMHLWHSYRPRLPKSLATTASIFNDDYYYWKDEIKGSSEDKQKKKSAHAMPETLNGLLIYWRYCGLDCHSTMVSFINLMKKVQNEPWVLQNYAREMAMQQGVLFHSNYVGAKIDQSKLNELLEQDRQDSDAAGEALEIATNGVIEHKLNAKKEDSFATPAQVSEWLYDGLKARAGKKGKTTDQKQLVLVAEQHPIYDKAISMLREYKEPKQRLNMYSKMQIYKQRFNFSYTALGTYTGRLSGRGSSFWTGQNPQNVPYPMRPMIIHDRDNIIFDADYSQADLYHFAVACGDQNMINTVFDDRDTHAVHVEMILKVPYNEVMEGKKNNDPFVVHPIKGVRQIIKKLCHGGNYGMSPPTAYLNAGREALEAAADYLGYDHGKWSYSRFLSFTEELTEPYLQAYSGQLEFRKRIVEECCANDGYATCFGDHRVYFHEHKSRREHDALMRALLAFYGQGGTSNMINQAMLDLHYTPYGEHKSFLHAFDTKFLFQTHDSLSFYIPLNIAMETNVIELLQDKMEVNCHFNNMDYVVPVEAGIGLAWGKPCADVPRRNITQQDKTYALMESWGKKEGLKANAPA